MEVNIMAWKDYETLDATPETATKKELEKLNIQHENEEKNFRPLITTKGARADMFKKRFPKYK